MRVAIVTAARSLPLMGFGLAEQRLLDAVQAIPRGDIRVRVDVVGGRGAWRYAKQVDGHWRPAYRGHTPRLLLGSPDLVHLMALDVAPPRGLRFVTTIKDLAPLRFEDEGRLPEWTDAIVRKAERIITSSQFTAHEVQELFGVASARLRVVPDSVGHTVTPSTRPLADEALAGLGLSGPFVLRLGGYTLRKNLGTLLRAWPEVRRRTGAL